MATASCSCKEVAPVDCTGQPGRSLFLLVSGGAPWDTFVVTATDAEGCWQHVVGKHDRPAGGHSFKPDEWMRHAKEALYDLVPCRQFTYETEFKNDGTLKLEWTATYDDSCTIVCACTLKAVSDTGAAIGSVLSHLCSSYRDLKGSLEKMAITSAHAKKQLSEAQAQCHAAVGFAQAREADLFTKFTLLLNTKKERMRELTQQVADAHAQVEQLQGQLQAAQANNDDSQRATTDEDEGMDSQGICEQEEDGDADEADGGGYAGPSGTAAGASSSGAAAAAAPTDDLADLGY
ncbi:hypothetical protein FOA52_005137 [Chlamydomonas sp. UWO 241]|nr:hypothetical protein FOA52_005137 [Chlamydomonas sp. UWO 241]